MYTQKTENMACNNRSGRQIKMDEPRDQRINLRISKSELAIIDNICKQRAELGRALKSRTDIIMIGIRKLDQKDITGYHSY